MCKHLLLQCERVVAAALWRVMRMGIAHRYSGKESTLPVVSSVLDSGLHFA